MKTKNYLQESGNRLVEQFRKAWNGQIPPERFSNLFKESFTFHHQDSDLQGVSAYIDFVTRAKQSVGNLDLIPEAVLTNGDFIQLYFRWSADRWHADILGGNRFSNFCQLVLRVEGGKIAEKWEQAPDFLFLLGKNIPKGIMHYPRVIDESCLVQDQEGIFPAEDVDTIQMSDLFKGMNDCFFGHLRLRNIDKFQNEDLVFHRGDASGRGIAEWKTFGYAVRTAFRESKPTRFDDIYIRRENRLTVFHRTRLNPASPYTLASSNGMVGSLQFEVKSERIQVLYTHPENYISFLDTDFSRHQEKTRKLFEGRREALVQEGDTYTAANTDAGQLTTPAVPVQDQIAIIGMAGRFPQCDSVEEYWDALVNNRCLFTQIPEDRPYIRQGTKVEYAGFINNIWEFDARFFNVPPVLAEYMDPQQRLMMETIVQSIDDSGHRISDYSGPRTALFVSTLSDDYKKLLQENNVPFNVNYWAGNEVAMFPSKVARFLNIQGPCQYINTECTSSLVALHEASRLIRDGDIDQAIVGATNLFLHPYGFIVREETLLSPQPSPRLFSRDSAGQLRAEAVVSVILKSMTKALSDGDEIYGTIAGSAFGNSGKTFSIAAANIERQAAVISEAWRKASVTPSDISLIECHASGVREGDFAEIKAIQAAFAHADGDLQHGKSACLLTAVKGAIGHAEAASGLTVLVKVLMQFRHRLVIATQGLVEIDPSLGLEQSGHKLITDHLTWDGAETAGDRPRIVGINGFAAGGYNAHVVIKEYTKGSQGAAGVESPKRESAEVIVLSARTEKALKSQIWNFRAFLIKHPATDLQNLAYTLQIGREEMEHRMAFVVSSVEDLVQELTKAGGQKDDAFNPNSPRVGSDEPFAIPQTHTEAQYIVSLIASNKLDELATAWSQGCKVPWLSLHKGKERQRLAGLPSYPFDRAPYGMPKERPSGAGNGSEPTRADSSLKHEGGGQAKLFGTYHWNDEPLPEDASSTEYATHRVLLCKIDNLRPEVVESQITGVSCSDLRSGSADVASQFLDHTLQILSELKALFQSTKKGKHLIQVVVPSEGPFQMFSALSGLLNTARKENPKVVAQLIQIPSSETSDQCIRFIRGDGRCPSDWHVRHHLNGRAVHRIKEIRSLHRAEPPWREDGVYLITGGMGRLGRIFAEDVTRRLKVSAVILVDRVELDRETAGHLKLLSATGSKIEYERVDLAQFPDVAGLIERILQRHGRLNGIIHAAGTLRDSYIPDKSDQQVADVFAPKVVGTVHLDRATRDVELDFFVLFSSITTLGNPGQADYSAANEFLNSYARYRNGLTRSSMAEGAQKDANVPHGRTLSINWPLWRFGGMKVDQTDIDAAFKRTGVVPLSTEVGIQTLYQGLSGEHDHLLVFEGDLSKIRDFYFPNTAASTEGFDVCCYQESWCEKPLPALASREDAASHPKAIICFLTNKDKQRSVARALKSHCSERLFVVFVGNGDAYKKRSRFDYEIAGEDSAQYEELMSDLKGEFGAVAAILHLWAYDDDRWISDVSGILYAVQALATTGFKARRLLLAAEFHNPLEQCYLESWIGFERSLGLSLPHTKVAVILREAEEARGNSMELMGEILSAELKSKSSVGALYRHGRRHVLQTKPAEIGMARQRPRKSGTYLITGGLGALGFMFARHIASQTPVNLVLTGRSDLDDAKREKIRVLELLRSRVFYLQADVSDSERMEAGLAEAKRRFGHLCGVIHAAGIQSTDGLLKDIGRFNRVTDPKIEGTLVLDRLTAEEPLDFVCYFSSSAAILGDGGACDYAVGNRFLMSYAHHRNNLQSQGKRKGRATVINWPLWKHGGMQIGSEEDTKFYLKSSGQRHLESHDGLDLFERLLAHENAQHLVLAGKPSRLRSFLAAIEGEISTSGAGTTEAQAAKGTGRRPGLEGLALGECLMADLKAEVAKLLKFDAADVDARTNLADLGFDSISLAGLSRALTDLYQIEISPALFFSYSSLGRLADYFLEEHPEVLERYYHEVADQPSPLPAFVQWGDGSDASDTEPTAVAKATGSDHLQDDIAIIGMSGRFPQARDIDAMWRILAEGRSAIEEVPLDRFNWKDFYGDPKTNPDKTNCKWMGALPGIGEFDPSFFEIPAEESPYIDPRHRLLLQESWRALEHAGYGPRQVAQQRVGMFVGVEEGDYDLLSQSASLTANHNGVLAARLAYFLDLHGPAMAINTSCSSGLVAAHQAVLNLRGNECDTAIVAGVHTLCSPRSFVNMTRAGMLSPDGVSFAFDNRANGMVPGEAVAVLVLRRLSDAEASGDPIQAVIRGSGINYDGKTNGMAAPSGASQARLIETIYEKYRINPEELDYVVAHGTGTKLGDAIELNSLRDAFRRFTDRNDHCAVTSTKGNFGHSFAASGLVSVISLVQALKHECIPKSLYFESGNDYANWKSSPFYVNRTNKTWHKNPARKRMGCVNSFGMSGTNAHMVIQEYTSNEDPRSLRQTPEGQTADEGTAFHLLVLSAKTRESLRARTQDMLEALQSDSGSARDLSAITYTLQEGRYHFNFRAAIVVESIESALAAWERFLRREPDTRLVQGEVPSEFSGHVSAEQLEAMLDASQKNPRSRGYRSSEAYRKVLETLGGLYCQGYDIDWGPLHEGTSPKRILLPTYPFARERHWADSRESGVDRVRAAAGRIVSETEAEAGGATGHLSEGSISADGIQGAVFQKPNPWAQLLDANHSILRNHIVQGRSILPGLAYVDLLYQFFRQKGYDHRALEIRNVSIFQPLIAGKDRPTLLHISCQELLPGQRWKVRIEREEQGGEFREKRFISADVLFGDPCRFEDSLDADSLATLEGTGRSLSVCYEKCEKRGLVHAGMMRAEGAIHRAGTADLLSVALPPDARADADEYMFHPTLIDGSAIGVGEIFFDRHSPDGIDESLEPERRLYLPLFYESFRASELMSTSCIARVLKSESRQKDDLIHLGIEFFNKSGKKVGELKNLTNKLVRNQSALGPLSTADMRVAGAVARGESHGSSRAPWKPPVSRSGPYQAQAEADEHVRRISVSLRELIASILKVSAKDIDTRRGYFDMGLDSVMLLDVAAEIEKRYSISLSPTLLFEHSTIEGLSRHLWVTHRASFEEDGTRTAGLPSARPEGADGKQPGGLYPRAEDGSAPTTLGHDGSRDVAVIGVAGRYPGANDIDQFWDNLKEGKDAVTLVPIDRWDSKAWKDFPSTSGKPISQWGAFVANPDHFDARFFGISAQEAAAMDPQERLFLEVCWEAIEDAGYTTSTLTPQRGMSARNDVGVFVGVMNNDYAFVGAEALTRGDAVPLSLSHAPIANRVSYFCNFHGPSMTVDTVCSASLTAVHLAVESVRRGECKIALAGGVSLSLHPNKYLTHGMLGMHSSDGRCRSFGEGGDGYVPGEGVGAILLKPLERAIHDSDIIYATIKGSAINHGGKVSGFTVPSPVAQADMVRNCFEQTGIDPRTITYVEAHGTGTSLGDPIEVQGLTRAFGHFTQEKNFCSIGSVKSNIGHAESAAGISGLTKTILQLYYKTLVPSLHSEVLNPLIDFTSSPFVVQRKTEAWARPVVRASGGHKEISRRAVITSFGATGSNACVILEEYAGTTGASTALEKHGDADQQPRLGTLVPLSAKSQASLNEGARRLLEFLRRSGDGVGEEDLTAHDGDESVARLRAIAYTLQIGREAMGERLAFLVGSEKELCSRLEAFLGGDQGLPDRAWQGTVGDSGKTGKVLTDDDVNRLVEQWADQGALRKIAEFWVQGFDVDWGSLWRRSPSVEMPRRLRLPTYPFERQRHWVGTNDSRRPHAVDLGRGFDDTRPGTQSRRWRFSLLEHGEPPESGDVEFSVQEKARLVLQQSIADSLNINLGDVDSERSIFELGLKSHEVLKVAQEINEAAGIRFMPSLLFEFESIVELSAHLAAVYVEHFKKLSVTREVIPSDAGAAGLVETEDLFEGRFEGLVPSSEVLRRMEHTKRGSPAAIPDDRETRYALAVSVLEELERGTLSLDDALHQIK